MSHKSTQGALYYDEDLSIKTLQQAEAYENKIVRKYIKELGYDNTRGQIFTYIK